jgi:L-ascorbate metabolism protein UlaG (beta-lactamase superfamily)
MKWVGHAAGIGKIKDEYRVLVGPIWGKDQLEGPGADWRTIMQWIFKNLDVRAWTGLMCFIIETGGGLL